MTPDIRLLLDVYEPFTRKLFEKYAKQKIYQKFKTISLHDFVTMFLKAGIATSRSKFDEG
jgi:ATP-dependent Zn protease